MTRVTATLESYAETWLAGLAGNLKASTILFSSSNLERYVLPSIGHRQLADVTRALLGNSGEPKFRQLEPHGGLASAN